MVSRIFVATNFCVRAARALEYHLSVPAHTESHGSATHTGALAASAAAVAVAAVAATAQPFAATAEPFATAAVALAAAADAIVQHLHSAHQPCGLEALDAGCLGLAGFDPEARARAAPKRGRQSARPTWRRETRAGDKRRARQTCRRRRRVVITGIPRLLAKSKRIWVEQSLLYSCPGLSELCCTVLAIL